MSLDQVFHLHTAPTVNTTEEKVYCRCSYSLGPIEGGLNRDFFLAFTFTTNLCDYGLLVCFLVVFSSISGFRVPPI